MSPISATRPEQLYQTDVYAGTQAQANGLCRIARTAISPGSQASPAATRDS
jgi:hypothetical protein